MIRQTIRGRLLKALAAAVLALTVGVALPDIAHADDPVSQEMGTLTIAQLHNEGATYDAYRVFAADVAPDGSATHLSWASDVMREAVLPYLDAKGYEPWLANSHPGEGQHDLAQNAAEFVASRMEADGETPTGDADDTGNAGVDETPFGLGLARALTQGGTTPDGVAKAGEPFAGAQGYWLFVTTDDTTEAVSEAGTLPLWLPLCAEEREATEKSAVPAVSIEVREDSTGAWGKTADAHRSQDVDVRVTGTLPSNFTSFDRYHYRLDLRLPKGVTLAVPEGKTLPDVLGITLGDQGVTADGTDCIASLEDGLLAIDFPDLRAARWQELGVNADTKVVVALKVRMDDAACVGMPGNAIEAILTYTDDPVSQGDGQTSADTVTIFTHRIELHKVAEQTERALAGAEFTMQVAPGNADEDSRGRYVGTDGALADTPQTLRTDDQGAIVVAGLDEGTYLIRETTAPVGFSPLPSDIELKVESTLSDMDQTLVELKASSSLDAARVTAIDPDTSTVALTVRDAALSETPRSGGAEGLPQTGVAPIASMLIAVGLTIAGISLIRSRT